MLSTYNEQLATRPSDHGTSSESSDLSDLGDVALEAETDKMDFLDNVNPDEDTLYRLDLSLLSKLTELARLKEVDDLDDDDPSFDMPPKSAHNNNSLSPPEIPLKPAQSGTSLPMELTPSPIQKEVSSLLAANGSVMAEDMESDHNVSHSSNAIDDAAPNISPDNIDPPHSLKRRNSNPGLSNHKRQKLDTEHESSSIHAKPVETAPENSFPQIKLEMLIPSSPHSDDPGKEHIESSIESANEPMATLEADKNGLKTDNKPAPSPAEKLKTPNTGAELFRQKPSGLEAILNDSGVVQDAEDDNDNDEDEDEEEDEDEDEEESALASRGLLRPEPHAEHSKHRKLAVRDLIELETEFSNLSDKLFHDHVNMLERELQWCEEGTHPELVRMNRRMEVYFRELLAFADHNLSYKLRCIDETTHATRTHIHQDFIKNLLDHKNEVMTETTSLWYEINHERTQFDRLVPDFTFTALPSVHERSEDTAMVPPVVPAKRRGKDARNGGVSAPPDATLIELVLQRNRIDRQLGNLNGLVEFYGFPAVVAGLLQESHDESDPLLELLLKRATPAEVDADLHAMKAVLT